jgi:hypothetical protein
METLRSVFAFVAARALSLRSRARPQFHLVKRSPLDPYLLEVHPSVTLRRVIAAVEAENGTGFCIKCGNEQTGCEPLSRDMKCVACGRSSVFGADEAFMAFLPR